MLTIFSIGRDIMKANFQKIFVSIHNYPLSHLLHWHFSYKFMSPHIYRVFHKENEVGNGIFLRQII